MSPRFFQKVLKVRKYFHNNARALLAFFILWTPALVVGSCLHLAQITRVVPECVRTYCVLHHRTPALKHLRVSRKNIRKEAVKGLTSSGLPPWVQSLSSVGRGGVRVTFNLWFSKHNAGRTLAPRDAQAMVWLVSWSVTAFFLVMAARSHLREQPTSHVALLVKCVHSAK